MTSSSRLNIAVRVRASAFTMVELLIVMGMIAALAAIAVPMIGKAHRTAVRTAMSADLSVISQALEAYHHDFGDYPRRTVTNIGPDTLTGASVLCWALIAPGPATQDGADGLGFRLRGTSGAVKGPYLPPDRFTVGVYLSGMSNPSFIVTAPNNPNDVTEVLADRNYRPILYFVANKAADGYAKNVAGGAYVGTTQQSVFNYADNGSGPFGIGMMPNLLTQFGMAYRLGAPGPSAGGTPDGNLYSPQVPAAMGPYLLWSPGPDTVYGTDDDVANNGNDLALTTGPMPSGI